MLAATIAYLPALRAEFVSDDQWVVDKQIPALANPLSIFNARANKDTWIYRPLTSLSFLPGEILNRWFVDPRLPQPTTFAENKARARNPVRARVPHAFSLLFHVLATGAVTLLIIDLLKDRRAGVLGGAVGGLIFALHPIHVGDVAWIAGRADTLATLFFAVSLLALFQARRRGTPTAYAFAAVAYLLALLSKENAAAGLLLVPLALRIHPEPEVAVKPLLKPAALYGGVLALYLALRGAGGGTVSVGTFTDLVPAVTQGLAAAGFYLRKILIPWPLTPLVIGLPGAAATVVSLAGGLAVFAVAAALFRRGERVYLFCVSWFVVTCLPVIPMAMKDYNSASVDERHLYLPSVGFALAGGVVAAALFLPGRRRAAGAAFGILLAVFGVTTWWSAAAVWRDNVTLYSTMTQQPGSSRHPASWVGLGNAYRGRKNLSEAERCYRRALEADILPISYQAEAWAMLAELKMVEAQELTAAGLAGTAIDRCRESERNFLRATEREPSNTFYAVGLAKVHYVLAQILEQQGRVGEATAEYRAAGARFAVSGFFSEAENSLRSSLRLNPGFASDYSGLGLILARQGKNDEALPFFRKAVRLSPWMAIYHNDLGAALGNRGLLAEALSSLREALRLDPTLASAKENLAKVLSLQAPRQ